MKSVRELRKVLVVLIIVLCLMPMSSMAFITSETGAQYNDLDVALANVSEAGKVLTLTGITNSTLAEGNVTHCFLDGQTINFAAGSSIRLNNTLVFNATGATTVTFAGIPNFTYDLGGSTGTGIVNNSLINVIGTSQTINAARNLSLNALGFTGSGINISASASNNNLAQFWRISGTTDALVGHPINLSGYGNTVVMSSLNITNADTTCKLFLTPTADQNTISDIDFTTTNRPSVYIYNGTAVDPAGTNATRSAWYFYNSTWSLRGTDMNVTINVSKLIPISGSNVGIRANLTNVTWTGGAPTASTINVTNMSLGISGGYSGGLLFNRTERTIFRTFPAMVPVNLTFGTNHFGNSYQELNLGTVYVLNFNPVNSITLSGAGQNFNMTGTTNWTDISDFTNAKNVTFVVDSGATAYTLYGNLSFLDPLDLTNPSTGTALARLGNALSVSVSGNSISLDVTATTGIPALDKMANLQVYPTTFIFTEGSTNIRVLADSTQIYNQGSWNRAGYVSDSAALTVGKGNITLPVLHFTTYSFGSGVSPLPPPPDNGGGGASGPASQQQVVQQQVVGETHTVSVNVGGNSAITAVAVTGTGINEFIATAIPQSSPPASITPPATTVYQYTEVSPARYSTISSVTFNFNVPASWLADKGYSKNDIVLTVWEPDAKTWTSLPTTVISEKEGTITYQAVSPHMSEFAIVYQKGAASQAQANVTVIQTSVPLTTTTTAIVTTVATTRPPAATPTPTKTVAPAPTVSPTGGLPTTTIVIAVVAIIVIVAAAFLVHRWWIRKQNPALFKDLK